MALCLQRRKDICSALKPAVIGEYPLNLLTPPATCMCGWCDGPCADSWRGVCVCVCVCVCEGLTSGSDVDLRFRVGVEKNTRT